uniref:Uncharacterized protein n=1 Tax=Aegilops tauschii subsp. strangulata TaxID=200361 RepID=A0A453NUB1_AEGTS
MDNRRLKENKMLAICFSSYDKCLMFLLCNIRLKSDFFSLYYSSLILSQNPKQNLRIFFIYTFVMM